MFRGAFGNCLLYPEGETAYKPNKPKIGAASERQPRTSETGFGGYFFFAVSKRLLISSQLTVFHQAAR
jgi:hypothetical protein